MLLLDFARNEVGVAMGSILRGRHIGWTTDADKARRLQEAGAEVLPGYGAGGSGDPKSSDTPPGWEIAFSVGAELVEEVVA